MTNQINYFCLTIISYLVISSSRVWRRQPSFSISSFLYASPPTYPQIPASQSIFSILSTNLLSDSWFVKTLKEALSFPIIFTCTVHLNLRYFKVQIMSDLTSILFSLLLYFFLHSLQSSSWITLKVTLNWFKYKKQNKLFGVI